MLDDGEILATAAAAGDGPEAVCRALVEAANSRGGHDNVTVVALAVGQDT
jgi:serine/threonine protein phosphatase PrpC